jgi:hypothetical protein
MSSTAQCPTCGHRLKLPSDLEGKRVRCPACQQPFTPSTAGESSASPKQTDPSSPRDVRPEHPADEAARVRRAADAANWRRAKYGMVLLLVSLFLILIAEGMTLLKLRMVMLEYRPDTLLLERANTVMDPAVLARELRPYRIVALLLEAVACSAAIFGFHLCRTVPVPPPGPKWANIAFYLAIASVLATLIPSLLNLLAGSPSLPRVIPLGTGGSLWSYFSFWPDRFFGLFVLGMRGYVPGFTILLNHLAPLCFLGQFCALLFFLRAVGEARRSWTLAASAHYLWKLVLFGVLVPLAVQFALSILMAIPFLGGFFGMLYFRIWFGFLRYVAPFVQWTILIWLVVLLSLAYKEFGEQERVKSKRATKRNEPEA